MKFGFCFGVEPKYASTSGLKLVWKTKWANIYFKIISDIIELVCDSHRIMQSSKGHYH